jgi:hypothetical protein
MQKVCPYRLRWEDCQSTSSAKINDSLDDKDAPGAEEVQQQQWPSLLQAHEGTIWMCAGE